MLFYIVGISYTILMLYNIPKLKQLIGMPLDSAYKLYKSTMNTYGLLSSLK